MTKALGKAGLLVLVVLAGGCGSTGTGWSSRYASTGLAPDETISVILNRANSRLKLERDELDRLEQNAGKCIEKALARGEVKLRVVSVADFRKAAFPGVAAEAVPLRPWTELLTDSASRERLTAVAAGIRYVISVTVSHEQSWETMGIREPQLAFGAGVFKRRRSRMEAEVLDLGRGRPAGIVSAQAEGSSGGGLVFVSLLPIPLFDLSFPESVVCEKFGREMVKFLVGEGDPASLK